VDYRFHGSKRQTYKRQQRPLLRDGHLRLPPAWLVRDLGKRNFGLGHYGTRLSALTFRGVNRIVDGTGVFANAQGHSTTSGPRSKPLTPSSQ